MEPKEFILCTETMFMFINCIICAGILCLCGHHLTNLIMCFNTESVDLKSQDITMCQRSDVPKQQHRPNWTFVSNYKKWSPKNIHYVLKLCLKIYIRTMRFKWNMTTEKFPWREAFNEPFKKYNKDLFEYLFVFPKWSFKDYFNMLSTQP